jgi:hydroxyacyl-ACP dehydratase HTD2-like protein with hotdog domain|tara:strand:- start:1748 stop:2191 length:444 start_codon:yes stop_codon:yes gene_type:complete
MPVYWEDLNVGDEIPVLTADISATQLFLISAVTDNPHRIHYDKDWALHEGYPERVIHGPLQGEMLAQTLQGWVGTTGWLRRLEYSNRAYAVLGERLSCKGKITSLTKDDGNHIAELDCWVEKDDGTVTAPGSATVVLPTREKAIAVG